MKKIYHIISLVALVTAFHVAPAKGAAAQANSRSLGQVVRDCDAQIRNNFDRRHNEAGIPTRTLKDLVYNALVSVVIHKKPYSIQVPEINLPNADAQRAIDKVKNDVVEIDLLLKDPLQLDSFLSLDEEEKSLAQEQRDVFDTTKQSIALSYTRFSALKELIPVPPTLTIIVHDYEGDAERIMRESFRLPLTSHFHLCTLIAKHNDSIQQEAQDRILALQLHDQEIKSEQKRKQIEKDRKLALQLRLIEPRNQRRVVPHGAGLDLLLNNAGPLIKTDK